MGKGGDFQIQKKVLLEVFTKEKKRGERMITRRGYLRREKAAASDRKRSVKMQPQEEGKKPNKGKGKRAFSLSNCIFFPVGKKLLLRTRGIMFP